MKLFHFTTADKVLPIKERGLLPSLEPQMSPDHAVVWLTSQPDVSLTERDAKAMALWLQAYEAPLDELQRMRAGETETFEAGRCKRWRYGTMGERLHMVINGQERTVTFVGDADDLVRLAIDVREDDANRGLDTPSGHLLDFSDRDRGDAGRGWRILGRVGQVM